MAHGRLGEWRRAQDALERGQRLAPNAEAAELLAEVRAVRRWERALARRAWDAEAHAQLGVLLMAWERGDEALVHLERAAALKPDWSVAHLYLGLEFHYRGDRDIAESHYLEAARLAPEDEAAPRYLAALRAGVLPGQDEPDASEDPWTATLVRATALQPVGAGAS